MKTAIKYLSILLLSILMVNCGKLESVSYGDINASVFPKSEKDIQALVMSCYYPLRGNWWDGINHNSERGQMFVNDCCTEILAGLFGAQLMCHNMSYNQNNIEVTYFYFNRTNDNSGWSDGFANKISRCTLAMDAIDKSDLSQEQKDKYMAEVRCARGYLSYILYDMYGPLVIAPLDVLQNPLKEVSLPRLSREDMVKFIEDDLTFAGDHLPYPKAADYGRFSRGLAKTLLIRLYLHETVVDKSYYNKVETIARELMTSDYGYSLVPDYTRLFQAAGMTKSNPEYIFVIPTSPEGPNRGQWQAMVMPVPSDSLPKDGWGQTVMSTWWFYDTFEPTDTRKTYLIAQYTNTEKDDKGNTVVVTYNRQNPNKNGPMTLGPIPQKYEIESSSLNSSLDIVEYRYPEVLLSLAEAIAMKPGGSVTQEAVDLMNMVRTRAKVPEKKLSDFPTIQSFTNQLLTERSHEFWCENGQYRADLIRFDKLYDRVMELNAGIAPFASKDKYVYPLPPSVIADGKGQVIQNPGYTQ